MISHLAHVYVLYVFSLEASAFTECAKSLLTVRYADRCPKDAASWQMAASIMNCDYIQQECSKYLGLDPQRYIFQYHCLMNSWMNATIEVCALNRSILGFCAEFDVDGALIQDNYKADCRKNDPPCPNSYNSAEAYKYQSCYYAIYRHHDQSMQADKERSSSSQLSLSRCCLLIPFFVLMMFI